MPPFRLRLLFYSSARPCTHIELISAKGVLWFLFKSSLAGLIPAREHSLLILFNLCSQQRLSVFQPVIQ